MTELNVRGVNVPTFMYGTAWKEEDTARLTSQALAAGFRAIDTANQRKHYHEAGVGQALAEAFAAGTLTRDALFLQTKFTHVDGQDHRLPYDPDAPLATQVAQSCTSSLTHLGVERLDSYVLHGPSSRSGFGDADREVWGAMERLHADGTTRLLGVSNVTLEQLETLCGLAEVPPAFVQNRCYARRGWDREVRAFCREREIVYQGFSLLTANREELKTPGLLAIAKRLQLTPQQLVFRFAHQVGMLPLTGSSSAAHLAEDLAALDAPALSTEDVSTLEAISG